MKRLLTFGSLLVVCVATLTTASASTLYIPGWYRQDATATIDVQLPVTIHQTVYLGSFRGVVDGTALPDPLYCLDVYHSFQMGDTWGVDPIVVPPDPPNPPPYNTLEASWVYHTYGLGIGTTEAWKAGGVQLALWEITHDQNWRSLYTPDTNVWTTTGNFKVSNISGAGVYSYAEDILDVLYAYGGSPPLLRYGTYYRPNENPIDGQGQFGEGPLVPEPPTILMLGMGLMGAAVGLRLRHRT